MKTEMLLAASKTYIKELRTQLNSSTDRALIKSKIDRLDVFNDLLERLSSCAYDGDRSSEIMDNWASKITMSSDIHVTLEKAYELLKSPEFKNDIDGLLSEYSKKERAYLLNCLAFAAVMLSFVGLAIGGGFLLGSLVLVVIPAIIVVMGCVASYADTINASNQKAINKKCIVSDFMSNKFFKSPQKEQDLDDTAKEQIELNATA